MTSPYEENKNKNAADLLRFEAEKQREKELAVDQERQNAGVPSSFSTGVDKKPLHQQESLADIVRAAISRGRSK
jgi:hypothetical protein